MNFKSTLTELHSHIRNTYPTSPHAEFEHKKSYKQIKRIVNDIFDAQFETELISKQISGALHLIGMNFHYYNYLAVFYGNLFRSIKNFESLFKKAPDELKVYYQHLNLPDSKTIYPIMKEDFEQLSPLIEAERTQAIERNPNWNYWEANVIDWDEVNLKFKGK